MLKNRYSLSSVKDGQAVKNINVQSTDVGDPVVRPKAYYEKLICDELMLFSLATMRKGDTTGCGPARGRAGFHSIVGGAFTRLRT